MSNAELEAKDPVRSGFSGMLDDDPPELVVGVDVVGLDVIGESVPVEVSIGTVDAAELVELLEVLEVEETPRLKPGVADGVTVEGSVVGTTPLVPLWPSPEQRPWHSGSVELDPPRPGKGLLAGSVLALPVSVLALPVSVLPMPLVLTPDALPVVPVVVVPVVVVPVVVVPVVVV
ncbi:MAG TPA: hypothetical protein VEF89_25100, partial [Solirubrobacteraceae bacterium]|nr:hypothetical protein [Solirubrobacteraceae bacterium]